MANLSVGIKLLLGFSVVLLLSLGVSATGFYGMSQMTAASEREDILTRLQTLLLEARVSERNFALTRQESSAQQLERTMTLLEQSLNDLDALASSGKNQGIEEIRLAIQTYSHEFNVYRGVLSAAFDRRERLVTSALSAVDSLRSLEKRLFNQAKDREVELPDGSRSSDWLLTSSSQTIMDASTLLQNMLTLRVMESEYLNSVRNLEVDAQWDEGFSKLNSDVERLGSSLSAASQENIERVEQSLQAYHEAFQALRNGRVERLEQENKLSEQGHMVLSAIDAVHQRYDAEVAKMTQRIYWQLIASTLGAIILGILASSLIARQIVYPLRETVELAQRIANGDLTQSNAVNRRDELGVLQNAMHAMTGSLQTLVGRIGSSVSQIAAAADQLRAVTAQTSLGVRNQRDETDQAATAMHEMAATVQEVARSAEQASRAAQQADREARAGEQVVHEAVNQVDHLASEVAQSANALEALHSQSNRIGAVLEVIRSVAEQTNLLALNAAIEAARAGEQGRGFAVVAEEVRALARRTHESTSEIEELISNLQRLTSDAVQQMSESRQHSDRTVDLAGEAGRALARITQTVSTIEQMNQQIAAAAEQQSVVADSITQNVTRVRDIGENSSIASDQTAQASAELARLGVELEELCRQSRV